MLLLLLLCIYHALYNPVYHYTMFLMINKNISNKIMN